MPSLRIDLRILPGFFSLCLLMLSGCVGARQPADPIVTGSLAHGAPLSSAQLANLGEHYDAQPRDRGAILNFAQGLRQSGETAQAVAVLSRGKLAFPNDSEISAAYGKALAENGDFEQALAVIRAAQRPDRPDFRLYAAEGAVLDSLGESDLARDRYARALTLAPGEPSVLNNLALSHLLEGNLGEAEKILRQAMRSPKVSSQVRQNLALVLGLKGDFNASERLAQAELSAMEATQNVSYLRSLLIQKNTWRTIQEADNKGT